MLSTIELLDVTDFPNIRRCKTSTLQVNLGYRCNQTCLHCHVNAGPNRTEMMSEELIELIPQVLKKCSIGTLDLTGGAPEMHPQFRHLVRSARKLGVKVIDRCNLTILFEKDQTDLAQFLADQQVEIIASLPCYSLENVDKQRGKGVFDRSIAGLKALNALGYGKSDSDLLLNLVYNPQGPSLPPPQHALEADYKRELAEHFGIVFNQLFTITNMPIKRFGSTLLSKGEFEPYMQLLKKNFSQSNLDSLMCRSTLSVDWMGRLYDCDFNQQLGLSIPGKSQTLTDVLTTNFNNNPIYTGDHCYGCTAGQGSSCGGALGDQG